MSAYIVANVRVTDPVQYEEYKRLASHAHRVHGAEVLVRGDRAEVLEGDWSPSRMVVLRFATMAAAHAFYDSPEYARARAARTGAAVMNMILLEGVDAAMKG